MLPGIIVDIVEHMQVGSKSIIGKNIPLLSVMVPVYEVAKRTNWSHRIPS